VREDGQKVLLAIKSMGSESSEAWRSVLDDLINRAACTPEFLTVDGALGLDKAIAAVWDGMPVQSCHAVLGVGCLRANQYAQGRRLADARHKAHRSAN
jgi:transposase-like protein